MKDRIGVDFSADCLFIQSVKQIAGIAADYSHNSDIAAKGLPNTCTVNFSFDGDNNLRVGFECIGVKKRNIDCVHFPILLIKTFTVIGQGNGIIMVKLVGRDNGSAGRCRNFFRIAVFVDVSAEFCLSANFGRYPIFDKAEFEMAKCFNRQAAPLIFGQFLKVILRIGNIGLNKEKLSLVKFFVC